MEASFAQLRIRVVTLGDLKRRRFTSIRRRQRQFSILPRVPGRAKSIATIICVAPKRLTKN
jgi:hypothetical protein